MSKSVEELDLVIIGSGPAGLTAAIYATRAKLKSIVLENEVVGGQITTATADGTIAALMAERYITKKED